MDWHDVKVFLLLAVIAGGVYYFGFHRRGGDRPRFDVGNSPTVSYTPMAVPGSPVPGDK